MTKAEHKILTAFLGKTLNITTDEVAQLFVKNGEDEELKPDSLKDLLAHDATRVKAFKDESDEKFLNGQKKATKEMGTLRDKEIKTKFEFDSDKIGVELIEELIAAKTKVPDLDDEKVKIHPVYTKAEKEFQKKLKEQEDNFKAQFEAKEKENARKETLSEMKKTATAELKKFKPIFGTNDEAKIQLQIDRLLMSDLDQYDYIKQDGQTIVMKDGKRLEDKHGKPILFDALVKDVASRNWEFETGESREGSGGDNDDAAKKAAAAAGKTIYTGKLPTNDEEFSATFKTLKTAEERIAFTDAVEGSKAKV